MQGRGETAHGNLARTETALERLLRAQAASLHLLEGHGTPGRPGCTMELDPAWGEGSCWHCPVGDDAAVFSYDIVLARTFDAACLSSGHFSVALERRWLQAAHEAAAKRESALIVGSAWKGQSFVSTPRPGERLQASGIILLPQALRRMSLRCQCDPIMLSDAIAALDGTKTVAGLSTVLDQMRQARPSAVVARAYYESKITEAMSLIVDWSLSGESARKAPLRPVDRTALNRARRHLADNLRRNVATEELCAVACMSASKLTGLFKAAEGVTPQEYARALRMELARKLLARTDLPLSAIASQLGFQRQGSFSEAFKERFRITPREYRNLARKQRKTQ